MHVSIVPIGLPGSGSYDTISEMKCTCHCGCRRQALAEENRTCRTCEFLDHKTFFKEASIHESRYQIEQRRQRNLEENYRKQNEQYAEQQRIERQQSSHQIARMQSAIFPLIAAGWFAGIDEQPVRDNETERERGCETVFI